MKPDSEIGVAIGAGHPCYFVGSRPSRSNETIKDVCHAEAAFIEEVARRHPDAESKPIVIANCQAGWQDHDDGRDPPGSDGSDRGRRLTALVSGRVRGKNPTAADRRASSAARGSTALSGDLGAGKLLDGASLIANFEQLNPANTYWTKEYNVYSKVDTEKEQRFLAFETYRGSPVLLNAGEMHWIVDNLFRTGNRLPTGQVRTSDGLRIDLRNIKSPIARSSCGLILWLRVLGGSCTRQCVGSIGSTRPAANIDSVVIVHLFTTFREQISMRPSQFFREGERQW